MEMRKNGGNQCCMYLRKWERMRSSVDILEKITKKLNCGIDDAIQITAENRTENG